jgi:hypothetical protein
MRTMVALERSSHLVKSDGEDRMGAARNRVHQGGCRRPMSCTHSKLFHGIDCCTDLNLSWTESESMASNMSLIVGTTSVKPITDKLPLSSRRARLFDFPSASGS